MGWSPDMKTVCVAELTYSGTPLWYVTLQLTQVNGDQPVMG